MASYTATARLQGGRPRRARSTDRPAPMPAASVGRARAPWVMPRDDGEAITATAPATVELRGSDWWERAAEAWAQTTFFLFHSEGWR